MESIIINNEPDPADKPTNKFRALLQRLKQPSLYLPLFVLFVFIAVLASVTYRYVKGTKQDKANKPSLARLFGQNTEETAISPLDGLRYSKLLADRHPLGVMIENHPDSRPQSGLTDAAVVYEAQAEGGITRFLAIFGPKIPAEVGPVRSARTYYLDWCLEYDCFYAHVGGNIDALDLIPKIGIKDLDQFRYGTSAYDHIYYRVPKKGKATEHTMYASPDKLYTQAKANNWPEDGGFPAIDFKQDIKKADRPTSQTIDIEISSKQFNTTWTYDSETNSYARTMGGVPHKDAKTGEQIKSKVVIVQEVPTRNTVTRINEQGLTMDTVGTGKATIFEDGKTVIGTWKKASQKARTIFYDETNNEIQYNPGQKWITIVTPGTKVTITGSPTPSP